MRSAQYQPKKNETNFFHVEFYKIVNDPMNPGETRREYRVQMFHPREFKQFLKWTERFGLKGATQQSGFEVLHDPTKVEPTAKPKGRPPIKKEE